MRNHGVSNFPDPKVTQNGDQVQVAIAVTPAITGAPQFKTAQTACAGILPGPISADQQAQQQHQRAQKLLAFARCMRARGVSDFPDPTSQGQLPLSAITAAGVDVAAPNVQSAAIACIPSAGGLLSVAAVRAAATQSQNGGSGAQSGPSSSQ